MTGPHMSREWISPDDQYVVTSEAITREQADSLFAAFPDNSVVRNQRTGEHAWVCPPPWLPLRRAPGTVVRGLGWCPPTPDHPDDVWELVIEAMEIIT